MEHKLPMTTGVKEYILYKNGLEKTLNKQQNKQQPIINSIKKRRGGEKSDV